MTLFPLRFHRKINLDTAKRPTLEALLEQPPPIHAEYQIQDMSLGSSGMPSIETIDGLHGSVEHDGLHGSVEPIEGLPRGSVFDAVDSMPSNNSKKKHQKLSYSDIMRDMTAFSDVTSKKTQKQKQVLLGGFYVLMEISRGTHDPSQSLLHLVEKNNNAFGDFHSQKKPARRIYGGPHKEGCSHKQPLSQTATNLLCIGTKTKKG